MSELKKDVSASDLASRATSIAISLGVDVDAAAVAAELDKRDEFARFVEEFHLPRVHSAAPSDGEKAPALPEGSVSASVYLCGNSLGLQPRRARVYVSEEMEKWASSGVEGHFSGERPWASIDEQVTAMSARLVGAASEDEVAVMNSLTTNLHLLLISFFRPNKATGRYKILMEDGAFCSDSHAIRSQLELHELDPSDALLTVRPRDGEHTLRTEDIVAAIKEHGKHIAVVLFAGVQFYTGQYFDIGAITRAAHEEGCVAGFDLAHAVGNVPLRLHDWGVDFAVWCSYKYLNAGPGSIGGAFVHARHADKTNKELPRLCGWWGQRLSDRFAMRAEWTMKPGAQSWQLSNPPVLPVVCLRAALELFDEAGGVGALRRKSLALTGFLEALLQKLIVEPALAGGRPSPLEVLTPTDPEARGCQLSLLLSTPVRPVYERLQRAGVTCDVREPNVLRVAPVPLYNTFSDVRLFVERFAEALKE